MTMDVGEGGLWSSGGGEGKVPCRRSHTSELVEAAARHRVLGTCQWRGTR